MSLVTFKVLALLVCMDCLSVVAGTQPECNPWNCPCAGVRPRRLQKRFYTEAGRDIRLAQNQTEHILGRMTRERFREIQHLLSLQNCAHSRARSPHCTVAHLNHACNLSGLPVVVRLGTHQIRTDQQGALDFVQVARALLAKMAVFVQQARLDEMNMRLGPSRSLARDIIQLEQDSLYYILCNLHIALNDTNISWGPQISREIMEAGCRYLSVEEQASTDNKNYLVFYTLKRLLENIADFHHTMERKRRSQKHNHRQHSEGYGTYEQPDVLSDETKEHDINDKSEREVDISREESSRELYDTEEIPMTTDDITEVEQNFSPKRFLDIKLHGGAKRNFSPKPYAFESDIDSSIANLVPDSNLDKRTEVFGSIPWYDAALWRSGRRWGRAKRSARRRNANKRHMRLHRDRTREQPDPKNDDFEAAVRETQPIAVKHVKKAQAHSKSRRQTHHKRRHPKNRRQTHHKNHRQTHEKAGHHVTWQELQKLLQQSNHKAAGTNKRNQLKSDLLIKKNETESKYHNVDSSVPPMTTFFKYSNAHIGKSEVKPLKEASKNDLIEATTMDSQETHMAPEVAEGSQHLDGMVDEILL